MDYSNIHHITNTSTIQGIATLSDIAVPDTCLNLGIIAQIVEKTKVEHIFILTQNLTEAEALYQDIYTANINQAQTQVLYASYEIKTKECLFNPILHSLRIQGVKNYHKTKKNLWVTTPLAMMEYLNIDQAQNALAIDNQTDEQVILDFLQDNNFESVELVTKYNQYARRGYILDIFSFGFHQPIRIEWDDNKIVSMRYFDIEAQTSDNEVASYNIVSSFRNSELNQNNTILDQFSNSLLIHYYTNAKSIEFDFSNYEIKLEDENPAIEIQSLERFLETLKEKEQRKFEIDMTQLIIEPIQPFRSNFQTFLNFIKDKINQDFEIHLFADDNAQFERLTNLCSHLNKSLFIHKISHEFRHGFILNSSKVIWMMAHEIFRRQKTVNLRTHIKDPSQTEWLKKLQELKIGDYVTHIDHGIGKFTGLEKITVNQSQQESIRLKYQNGDLLYIPISSLYKISKHIPKEGHEPKLSKLGSDTWNNLKNRTKKYLKDIAQDLIQVYAKRMQSKGFAFSKDNELMQLLEANFEFDETVDQFKAIEDVKSDMEKDIPMDRLICGDVGFGKTEIAIRAAFKAVCDSKQVVVLVPTTLLAFQHYQTFKRRMRDLPCTVAYLNRFVSSKNKNQLIQDLAQGKVDIVIATHGIVSDKIKFKDLGLLIIDEEQKFGVAVKEKLKSLKHNIDTLTLTATPIPRTLQFSLLGARDYTLLQTPPVNRLPIYTEVINEDFMRIRDIIRFELSRNGQVFFVHNRVRDIEILAENLRTVLPEANIAVAHAQLKANDLELTILDFIEHKYDVLLSTNIIESGIDIQNCNTIIIHHAHQFGLSDLHQLRGRVGRSDQKAFCYLVVPSFSALPEDARSRLRTLEQNAHLGSGFQISLRDLDIRGAGNLLGAQQSGFIQDMGYDTYLKILNEALTEMKNEEADMSAHQDINYVTDCVIESDLPLYFDTTYIANSNLRIEMYQNLNSAKNEEELAKVIDKIQDIFGKIPKAAQPLIDSFALKLLAKRLGITKVIYKEKQVKLFFPEQDNSQYYQSQAFGQVLEYIQDSTQGFSLVQRENLVYLHHKRIDSINKLIKILEEISSH
ncbi:MAG: transcription-repair coupling factor [Chitinophagales bacterium]|nr:transcription-repair coupling factor [Chitinophagales bacterium]